MARYIDADSLYCRVKTHTNPYGKPTLDYESGVKVLDMIEQEPTADVVPKSEVDRLVDKWIGEENLTQDAMVLRLIKALRDEAKRYEKYYFNHEYDKLIADAKQEVAREIFEEIDGITDLFAKGLIDEFEMYDKLAELKKKYIKSEGNI